MARKKSKRALRKEYEDLFKSCRRARIVRQVIPPDEENPIYNRDSCCIELWNGSEWINTKYLNFPVITVTYEGYGKGPWGEFMSPMALYQVMELYKRGVKLEYSEYIRKSEARGVTLELEGVPVYEYPGAYYPAIEIDAKVRLKSTVQM